MAFEAEISREGWRIIGNALGDVKRELPHHKLLILLPFAFTAEGA